MGMLSLIYVGVARSYKYAMSSCLQLLPLVLLSALFSQLLSAPGTAEEVRQFGSSCIHSFDVMPLTLTFARSNV